MKRATMFGRAIADRYMAVQVNVRNLSKDNQFLMHDVQLAVLNQDQNCDTLDPLCSPVFSGSRREGVGARPSDRNELGYHSQYDRTAGVRRRGFGFGDWSRDSRPFMAGGLPAL